MFASVTKLVDKNFAIGFLIPTIAATTAAIVLCRDVALVSDWYAKLTTADSFGSFTYLALLVWLVAVVLLVMNDAVYRTFEGYVGPLNWERGARRMRERFRLAKAELDRQFAATDADARRDYHRGLQRLFDRFPTGHERFVLPTRFGNAIRAFEAYSHDVYGADAIPTWLRLQHVMPKDAHAAVADARAQVDFFLNLCVFSAAIAALALARVVVSSAGCIGAPAASCVPQGAERFLFLAVAAAVMAVSYEAAIHRAIAWGHVVKSCFDVYLPALAKQLGYRLPPTRAARRAFWSATNTMFIYRRPVEPAHWTRDEPAPLGRAAGPDADDEANDDAGG